jgi:hypothetical protein
MHTEFYDNILSRRDHLGVFVVGVITKLKLITEEKKGEFFEWIHVALYGFK